MASSSPAPSGSIESGWSWSWLRNSIFGSPNLSTHAFDGDYEDRMLDDINYMQLRDGKRLDTHPSDRSSERNSEADDNASLASVQTSPPDLIAGDETLTSFSSFSGVGSSAWTSDTGFSTPRGRRYLSFADCQQLPKTDYMYAYTPVYSPSIYNNKRIEMPNMCRMPIRSSAAGSSSAEYYSLRSRSTKVGNIPLYGTDDETTPKSSSHSLTGKWFSFLSQFFRSKLDALCFWLKTVAFFFLATAPKAFFRKLLVVFAFSWYLLKLCLTKPVMAAVSTGEFAAEACSIVVIKFWMTIRRTITESKEMTARSASWLRRYIWPFLLLLLALLLLIFFPYNTAYQNVLKIYNSVNTTAITAYFYLPEKRKDEYVEQKHIVSPASPPSTPDNSVPPVITEVKASCSDCWKPYLEEMLKIIADRDREIVSKFDLKLASALAAGKSQEQISRANDRLTILEQTINELKTTVSEGRENIVKTIEQIESNQLQSVREEEILLVKESMEKTWQKVEDKISLSTAALERKLSDQRSEVFESLSNQIREDLRKEIETSRVIASEAALKADAVSEMVASIPSPSVEPPVVVECKTACPDPPLPSSEPNCQISITEVEKIVGNAISRYDADRTGLPDFALESSGGSVVSVRCSKTYDVSAGTVSIFGFPIYFDTKSPRTTIQAGPIVPGNCWAFSGSRGYLVIRLSYNIFVSAVSLEHIPKELALLGRVDSAPKDFSVYGLTNESELEGQMIGNFTYDAQNGAALQTFATEEVKESFQFIEMRVLSNYGHPEYTCIYRLRVHGIPFDKESVESN